MARRLVFHPEIEADVRNVSDWYETRLAGLGSRFREEFFSAAAYIQAWPLNRPIRFDSIRAAKLERFPYLVFFAVEPEAIWVLALQFAGRDPAWLREMTRDRGGRH